MPGRFLKPAPGLNLLAGLLVLGIAAGLASCSTGTPGEKTNVPTLQHHNWWNFYQRGLALIAAGDAAAAREDFERCIGIRSGATYSFPEDLWRARTYGLHFTEHYFPHRELGVCYYVLGDDTQAIRWLTVSLDQTPSGRAKYYLNLARKRSLESRRVTTPSVEFNAESRNLWTRDRSRTLSGTASGPGYVSDITIEGRRQFIELAATNMPFTRAVPLIEGTNVVHVTVTDLAGNVVVTSRTWIADWRPPALLIRHASKQGADWVFEGTCDDDHLLARVIVRNASSTATVLEENNPGAALSLNLRFRDGETLMLEAVDAAGNTFETKLSGSLLAPIASGATTLRYAAADDGGMADVHAPAGGSAAVDDQAPDIQLALPASLKIFSDELVLQGTVSDAGGLDSLRIRDTETLRTSERGSVSYGFTLRIALDVGTNAIVVTARDRSGHSASQSIVAVRKVPDYLDRHYRLSLVLPPFLCHGEGANALGEPVQRRAEQELTRDPARFFLVERAEGWDLILREQRLALSDLADPHAVLQLGKVLPAELFMIGSLFPHGAGTTISAVIADAETGEVLAMDDVYSEALDADMESTMAGLVMKLEQRFPLVDGTVTEVRKGKAVIDAGSHQGVIGGARFLVIHPPSPGARMEEGELQSVSDTFVQLRVQDVEAATGTAEIRPAEGRELVRTGDYIYAR